MQPQCLAECICRLRPGQTAFYDLRNQTIFQTMLELYDDGVPIDLVTLTERLQTWGTLEQVGGMTYIATLPDNVPSAANLPNYLDIVMNKFMLRRTISVCTEAVGNAYEANGHSPNFLSELESNVLGIRSQTEAAGAYTDILRTVHELNADYDAAHTQHRMPGILTGFTDLDHICGGMMPQEMIVLAGMPSAGKTTLALNIAYNVAAAGSSVGFISLETSGKKLVHRLACYVGEVEGGKLLRGQAEAEDVSRISTAFGNLVGVSSRLMLSEAGQPNVREVEATARRMVQRGAQLIVVDYLQLLYSPGAKSEYDQTTQASKAIKGIARSLNVPVIVVSAFNREPVKGQKPRPPKLSDLRMSGQIEYDADKGLLLYDPEFRTEFNPHEATRKVACRVAKQKDGPLGTIELTFFPRQFRMESLLEEEEPAGATTAPTEPEQQQLPVSNDP